MHESLAIEFGRREYDVLYGRGNPKLPPHRSISYTAEAKPYVNQVGFRKILQGLVGLDFGIAAIFAGWYPPARYEENLSIRLTSDFHFLFGHSCVTPSHHEPTFTCS